MFIYFEREQEQERGKERRGEGERERERVRVSQAGSTLSAQILMLGSISRTQGHYLSQNQEPQTQPTDSPRHPYFFILMSIYVLYLKYIHYILYLYIYYTFTVLYIIFYL